MRSLALLLLALYAALAAAACPSADCGCGWASAGSCGLGSRDGSTCWDVCCCRGGFVSFDDAATPTTQAPTAAASAAASTTAAAADAGVLVRTTRYHDCCKPACAWPSNVSGAVRGFEAVRACTAAGDVAGAQFTNVCGGGGGDARLAYSCPAQAGFTTADGRLLGFAASNVRCCACYRLTFEPGSALAGRSMVVQVTNGGADLSPGHFDVQMPGAGFGIFNGCARTASEPANGAPQWPAAAASDFGARYGGVAAAADCAALPPALRAACEWRFAADGFAGADNPAARAARVRCPAELTAISGCRLADDAAYPDAHPDGSSTNSNSNNNNNNNNSNNSNGNNNNNDNDDVAEDGKEEESSWWAFRGTTAASQSDADGSLPSSATRQQITALGAAAALVLTA